MKHIRLLDRLKLCETFIAEELECRKASLLPSAEEDALGYIGRAREALAAIKSAIREVRE